MKRSRRVATIQRAKGRAPVWHIRRSFHIRRFNRCQNIPYMVPGKCASVLCRQHGQVRRSVLESRSGWSISFCRGSMTNCAVSDIHLPPVIGRDRLNLHMLECYLGACARRVGSGLLCRSLDCDRQRSEDGRADQQRQACEFVALILIRAHNFLLGGLASGKLLCRTRCGKLPPAAFHGLEGSLNIP